MGSSFINLPYDAILQAARRRRVPHDIKDADEIPLDGMQAVSPQSQPARELPIASSYTKDSDHTSVMQREVPLGQVATVQPLSNEQEIDLAPIPGNDKTREGYQALYNAGTPKPQMPDHSNEHHGFWGNAWQHLKHGAKGAAIGALLGSRAGGGGAIGGALLGGLTGVVSPRAADTMEYRTLTEPRWEHEQQIAQEEAARKEGVARDYAQQFGTALFDPNQSTEAKRYRIATDETNRLRNRQMDEDRDAARSDKNRQNAEVNSIRRERLKQQFGHYTDQQMQAAYNSGALNGNPDALRHYADRLGIPGDVEDKFLPGMIKQVVDGSGQFVDHNLQTGANTATGIKSGAFEQRKQGLGIQQQNATTNAGRAAEGVRHNQATERQAVVNETGRAVRSKKKGGGGLLGIGEEEAPQSSAASRADDTGNIPNETKAQHKDPRDGKMKQWVYRGRSASGKQQWEVVQ